MKLTIVRPRHSIQITPSTDDAPRNVVVTKVEQQIVVKRDGARGLQGPEGPQGPAGPPGTSAVDDPGDLTLFFNNALI